MSTVDGGGKSVSELPVRVRCPAKVNLLLRVGPPRGDGFHPLLSWMATVGLFDTLELFDAADVRGRQPARPGKEAGPLTLECRGDAAEGVPCDETNLVVRIASAFAEEVRRSGPAASCRHHSRAG